MTKASNQPVEVIRDGSLKVAIFKNETDKGVRFSGQLDRSYTDDQGKWHSTTSLSNAEFLRGARLLAQAYDRIAVLKAGVKNAADDDGA